MVTNSVCLKKTPRFLATFYSPKYLFTFEELEGCGKIADVVDSLQLSPLHGLQQTDNTDFKHTFQHRATVCVIIIILIFF